MTPPVPTRRTWMATGGNADAPNTAPLAHHLPGCCPPSGPRRDDLTEISEELVRDVAVPIHAESVLCEEGDPAGCNGYCRSVARAALAAVLPDYRARVERELLARCAAELRAQADEIALLWHPALDEADRFHSLADRWSAPIPAEGRTGEENARHWRPLDAPSDLPPTSERPSRCPDDEVVPWDL